MVNSQLGAALAQPNSLKGVYCSLYLVSIALCITGANLGRILDDLHKDP